MLDYHATGFQLLLVIIFFLVFFIVYCVGSIPRLQWIPEACVIMTGGLVCAIIGHFAWNIDYMQFDSGVFYLFLLPILIFNSGIELNISSFYQNFIAIMVYANLGTLINAIVVAVLMYQFGELGLITPLWLSECISFGALISATDPVSTIAVFERLHVEPHLYAIVVGVSVLDDAVSVLIFDLVKQVVQSGNDADAITPATFLWTFFAFLYKFLGSIVLGYALGLAYAYFLRCQHSLVETREMVLVCLTVLFVYAGYLAADLCLLSGITAALFAGLSFRTYYAIYDPDAFALIRTPLNQLSYAVECAVFAYMGVTGPRHAPAAPADWLFTALSVLACFLGRIAQIYPLAWLLNAYNAAPPKSALAASAPTQAQAQTNSRNSEGFPRGIVFSAGQLHMMLLAGLRGPIAYGTAQLFDNANGHRHLVAAATGVTVLATTFFYGALTVPALDWCAIQYGADAEAEAALRHHHLRTPARTPAPSAVNAASTNDFLFSAHGMAHPPGADSAPDDSPDLSPGPGHCGQWLSEWFAEGEEMVLRTFFLDQQAAAARQYASLHSLAEDDEEVEEVEEDPERGTRNALIRDRPPRPPPDDHNSAVEMVTLSVK